MQQAFVSERDRLIASDELLYPNTGIADPEPGHHHIAWEARRHPMHDPALGTAVDLAAEWQASGCPRAFVSSEAFTGLLADDPQGFWSATRTAAGTDDVDVTVIVVVRRIDEFVASSHFQRFTAWLWGRPFVGSTDLVTFVTEFDVGRHLAVLQALLASPGDVRFLAYGPEMVGRVSREMEVHAATLARLRSYGGANARWLGPRAVAVLTTLIHHADEPELRMAVSRRRGEFEQILSALDDAPVALDVMPRDSAVRLLAAAEPLYREVGPDFHRAVVGTEPLGMHQHSTTPPLLDVAETARIDGFFGMRVLG